MRFINIGFGNVVAAQRILAVLSPDSAPIKRMIQEAKERGMLVDASFGRSTRAVLLMDTDHVILSALGPEQLSGRGSEETENERKAVCGLRAFGRGKKYAAERCGRAE